MSDRGQDESKDKTSELLKVLPFMSAFPFNDYEITMVEHGQDFITMGVSPILLNAFGDNGTVDMLNFSYVDGESSVAISIYRDDAEWISEEAIQVKKMDSLRVQLDEALDSEDLIKKIKAIKSGKKFSKIIHCDNIGGVDFGEVLSEFLKVNETVLQSKTKLGLQKLSEATLKSTEFSEQQFKATTAFLNFQIHYIKILLGIVIAAKIY
jgi:hypothetical protein